MVWRWRSNINRLAVRHLQGFVVEVHHGGVAVMLHDNRLDFGRQAIRILKYSQSDIFHGLFTKLTQLRKNLNADGFDCVSIFDHQIDMKWDSNDLSMFTTCNSNNSTILFHFV